VRYKVVEDGFGEERLVRYLSEHISVTRLGLTPTAKALATEFSFDLGYEVGLSAD
jgi:hypothetical protein